MGEKLIISKGEKYGRFSIIEESNKVNSERYFLCLCECGTIKNVSLHNMRSGVSTSCGCYQKESCSNVFKTHGLRRHPLYRVWQGMKDRCYNKNNKEYKSYGGRGISVCDDWKNNFIIFYKDMILGYNKNLTIDRIDNNMGYSKSNCRWATKLEQSENTSRNIIPGGLSKYCRENNLLYSTVRSRIRRGYSIEESLY